MRHLHEQFVGAVFLAALMESSATTNSYVFIPRPETNGPLYKASSGQYSERCRYPPTVGSSVPAIVFNPSDSKKKPGAVILLHECVGLEQYVLTTAEALSTAGFIAVVLNLFRESSPAMTPTDCRYINADAMNSEASECMWKMQHLNWTAAVEDVGAAAKYIQDTYAPAGIATWGFSMGGALSLLVASKNLPHISACIAFYGYPDHGTATGSDKLFDPSAVKIPVLFESGSLDPFGGFSAPSMTDTVRGRLSNANITATIQYGCSHSFMNDASWWHLDGGEHANESCRQSGFADTISFLAGAFHVQPDHWQLKKVDVRCPDVPHLQLLTSHKDLLYPGSGIFCSLVFFGMPALMMFAWLARGVCARQSQSELLDPLLAVEVCT